MKKIKYYLGLITIVILVFGSCKKWADVSNPDNNNLMDVLIVSESFDWKTTKTLNISLVLPSHDPEQVVRIYTEDLEELLYIGYGNTNTKTLDTKITIASQINSAYVYYGYNNRYVPILLGIDSDLNYDYNLDLKSTKVDCGCDTQIKTLTMQYNGATAATIYVKEKGPGGNVIFESTVEPGANFTFNGSQSGGDMKNDIELKINGTLNVTIKVDCNYYLYNGDVFGDFTLISGISHNSTPLCDEGSECGCSGGMITLTLRYTGSSAATIEVKEDGPGGGVIFTGVVQPNADFSFTGSAADGKIKNTIKVFVNEVENTSIHTSCSVPIEIGDVYGDFKIAAGYTKNNLFLCGTIEDPPGGGGNTTSTHSGTLAYEDLWPSTGDYDFNDLVISYNFIITKDDQNRVLTINSTFIVYAFGASYHNGFGFSLPSVSNNQIINVSGYSIESGSIYNIAANGLEQNQSHATIIVYDDAYNILLHPGVGIGVNTVVSAPYITPDTVKVNMVFYENGSFGSGGPVTFGNLDIGNFNPFIVIDQARNREVHLPNYAPTSLADQSVFGTFNDDSNPSAGRYYKSENNLPWAINIPSVFNYPFEKREIVLAYLKFGAWAESSGTLFQDWYDDNTGYRNNTFIYYPN